ncbi:hypothetical protein HNY73_006517 [Argiope bruennichi]|uniref:Uncharacterized protein n=1 Tax=Argiope bruennichi TaxID=94029 RepID=A0A8T0FDT2_ARGBR|nr:hypothetical protein HNY73_006517 [Argiope bruennichi]
MVEIKEIDQSGAVRDEKWEQMREELHKTRKAIKLALQQLINMRKEQVAYKLLLDKEIGVDVDPKGLLPYKPKWRYAANAEMTDLLLRSENSASPLQILMKFELGKPYVVMRNCTSSCEKTYLKSELVGLVDRLQALDPKFRFDPEGLPSTLSTSREVLLTKKQMDDMCVLYQNYSVYRSENERKATETFRDYIKMRDEYEMKLLHNNAMMDEINATRKKINELKTEANEDKCFMKFLVTFKLYKEKPITVKADTSKCLSPYVVDPDANENELQLQKYKKMWKNNLEEKEYFRQCLESLEQRLEDTHHRIVMAERLCLNNAALVHDLQRKVQEEVILFREQDVGGTDDSFKQIYWGVSGQLMAALNENKYVRKFLQRNVLPTEKDFLVAALQPGSKG